MSANKKIIFLAFLVALGISLSNSAYAVDTLLNEWTTWGGWPLVGSCTYPYCEFGNADVLFMGGCYIDGNPATEKTVTLPDGNIQIYATFDVYGWPGAGGMRLKVNGETVYDESYAGDWKTITKYLNPFLRGKPATLRFEHYTGAVCNNNQNQIDNLRIYSRPILSTDLTINSMDDITTNCPYDPATRTYSCTGWDNIRINNDIGLPESDCWYRYAYGSDVLAGCYPKNIIFKANNEFSAKNFYATNGGGYGGVINIEAKKIIATSLNVYGAMCTQSSCTQEGPYCGNSNGGDVTLKADMINVGTINANHGGGATGAAGKVTITANSTSITNIYSNGGYYGGCYSGLGGDGGTVQIKSGSSTINYISASAGNNGPDYVAGKAAGSVNILSDSLNLGTITADASRSGYGYGAGGNIKIYTQDFKTMKITTSVSAIGPGGFVGFYTPASAVKQVCGGVCPSCPSGQNCVSGVCQPVAVDNPPSVSASNSPANPKTTDTVTVSAAATDDRGLKQIDIYVDGGVLGLGIWPTRSCPVSGTSASCQYSSTYAAGSHSYYAIATDTKPQTAQSSTGSCSVTAQPFGCVLSASPSSGSVAQGSSAATTVTATLTSGATQSVSLSCSGLPAGASCSFSPSWANPTYSSSLKISTSTTTPAGTYPITISGTNCGTVPYSLIVTASASASCADAFAGKACNGRYGQTLKCGCKIYTCQ